MIETEKVLHLKRYVTLVQTGVKSRIASSHFCTHGTPDSPRGGYVSHMHLPQWSVQSHLRPENYVATYARMFSTIVQQSFVDDINQKLSLLCNDVKKGQVLTDDLKEILKLCNYQPCDSTSILLLRCCGNLSRSLDTSERQKLIDQVWNLAKRSSEQMTLDHYNTLLHIQMENSIFINPIQFLADMTVEPDKNTYHLLLNVAAKMDNNKYQWDIMSLCKEKNISFDEDVFNTLIQMNADNGNITVAEHLVTLMQDAKLSTVKAYTELACGYARLNDIPNLIKILNDKTQSDSNLLRITKVLSSSGNEWHIPAVLNFLTAPLSTNKSEILETIIELTRTNQVTAAFKIISCFPLNDVTSDIVRHFVNSFLNELVVIEAPIVDIVKYASKFMDLDYEPLALSNVADISLKLGREDLCYAIFDAMKNKNMEIRSHYYWPLLTAGHRNEGEVKIFSILKSMMDADVELDFDTLFNYAYPYMNTVNPQLTLQRMRASISTHSDVFLPLVIFLLSKDRLQDVINLCEYSRCKISPKGYKMLTKYLTRVYFSTRDVQSCVTLLTMYPHDQSFVSIFLKMLLNDKLLDHYLCDVQLILQELVKCKGKISHQDANDLKRTLTNNLIVTTDTFTSYRNMSVQIDNLVDKKLNKSVSRASLKYMNTKDLECFLVQLKSKRMPTKNVLRKLLETYCNEDKLNKIEQIKCEFDACRYEWTDSMKLNMFEVYVKHNKLREAEAIILDINDTYEIDRIKIITFAIALVKANRSVDAYNIIRDIKNINNKHDVQTLCYTLLDTLAHSQYHDQTEKMMDLLVNQKYCTVNTELLRPLIAIPLERNDISQAVDTFIKYALTYNKIPLALEVLTALMKHRNSVSLADPTIKRIHDLLTEVRSSSLANTTFALALAILNKTRALRDIVQKEELSINVIVFYANYVRRIGKPDILLRLFEALADTENTNDALKLMLCNMLLHIYGKLGDYNGALNLWNKMCARNLKFNEQSKQIFIQLLLQNKVSLPHDLANTDLKDNIDINTSKR